MLLFVLRCYIRLPQYWQHFKNVESQYAIARNAVYRSSAHAWEYAALHCTALHCTAMRCVALHCIALHCIALHRMTNENYLLRCKESGRLIQIENYLTRNTLTIAIMYII